MTDDPNGWPDAARPGVPMRPEKDGRHWLDGDIWEWSSSGFWVDGTGAAITPSVFIGWGLEYEAPCLTPAEVAAREAAAAEAMREACAVRVAHLPAPRYEDPPCDWLRALPLPAPAALDRVRKEAKREGMEEAAGMLEEVARSIDGPCVPGERNGGPMRRQKAAWFREQAAAIRARMEADNAEG